MLSKKKVIRKKRCDEFKTKVVAILVLQHLKIWVVVPRNVASCT